MTESRSTPQLSIIIPTRNEAGFIDACLRSVFAADPVPGGFEVLVIDGLSDDGTRAKIAKWCEEWPNMRCLDNPRMIVPTAMNIGIRAAHGKWVIRLDAHSEYPRNYFTLCVETSQRTGAENVGGSIATMSQATSAEGRLVRALTTHPVGVGNAGFRVGAAEGQADTVPFGCYLREVFDRIGCYDERLVRNQDYELNRRLAKAGGRIWFNPSIRAIYYNQPTLKGLFRQAIVTGRWNVLMWYVAPYSFAWRHAVPLVFVLALLAFGLVSTVDPRVGLAGLALVVVPYGMLVTAASLQQANQQGAWMLPCLPFLFGCYHVSYGVGGLLGFGMLLIKHVPRELGPEPWPGAGSFRAWPIAARKEGS